MSDIFRDYSFGGWIRHIRTNNQITLRDAAKAMNTSPGNLSKLERSELPPPRKAKRVKEIVEAIGRNPDSVDLLLSLAFQHHLTELSKEFNA